MDSPVTVRAPILILAALAIGACRDKRDGSPSRETATAADTSALAAPVYNWTVRPLANAPARFRPGGWSDDSTLWGLVRGRVTRLDIHTGATHTLSSNGWWVRAASGVASWRNERGMWIARGDANAVQLRDTGNAAANNIVWSRDGRRAVLKWDAEGRGRYDVLEQDGSTRTLDFRLPGYTWDEPALWLDSTRVLFHVVALASHSGVTGYQESGWRGALAVLDLRTSDYRLVADVPDGHRLFVAGPYLDKVLVSEWGGDTAGVRAQWLYDSRTWERQPARLPPGRAFPSVAGAAVILLDPHGDSTPAVLFAGRDSINVGRVARDAEPAFSPSGRLGSVHTSRGVIIVEARPR